MLKAGASRDALARKACDRLVREAVRWSETDDPDFPCETRRAGILRKIRIDNCSNEPLYSLMREEEQPVDFDDWPSHRAR